jgi:hypothetical protein
MKPVTKFDVYNKKSITIKHNKRMIHTELVVVEFNVGEIPDDAVMQHIYSCFINYMDKKYVYDKFQINFKIASHTENRSLYVCIITINNNEISYIGEINKKIKDYSYDIKHPNYKNKYLYRLRSET